MLTLFVTASGTEVGKTLVAAGLLRAWRAAGRRVAAIKPVMSGFDPARIGESDAGRLLAACGEAVTAESVASVSPWRFAPAVSPDMAAARAGTAIDFETLLHFCREARARADDVLLVEAAGGVMAPLTAERTMLDWAASLGWPVLLVGGTSLGSISHVLTAWSVLRGRGVPVARVVLSESAENPVPAEETRETVARHLRGEAAVALVRRGATDGAGREADLHALAASLGQG